MTAVDFGFLLFKAEKKKSLFTKMSVPNGPYL